MEREVLLLLRRLHAEEGRVTRERLTVVGRGRGLEIARSLMQLKAWGLVKIVEHRPSFWRRLLGAKPQELLLPLPEQDVVTAPVEAANGGLGPQVSPLHAGSEQEVLGSQYVAPAFDFSGSEESNAANLVAASDTKLDGEDRAHVAPFVSDDELTEEASAAHPAAVVEASSHSDHAVAVSQVAESTGSASPAPSVAEHPYQPNPITEVVGPSSFDSQAAVPVATSAAPQVRPARPAPSPLGYTDELGGAPAEFNLAPRLDSALVDGMRDFLGGLGLELTYAGEALAAQRLQMGAVIGEVVGEIAVFALAHAAHHEGLSGFAGEPEDLRDYGMAILEELQRLVEAGEISPSEFEAQKTLVLQLTDRTTDRSLIVSQLLADPIGGAAPPALLPEELRGVEDDGEDFFKDL